MARQELIEVGRLGRPHGIRGDIRADYDADSPLLLEKPLWLQAGSRAPRPIVVTAYREWRGQMILHLEGVEDRTAAEGLRGCTLLVREADLPEADPEEPYVRDLLGLTVALADTGERVGTLEDVSWPAGQELWTIRSPEGCDMLFPAVPELVDDMDLEAGILRISPPPGLLELYRPAESSGKKDETPS